MLLAFINKLLNRKSVCEKPSSLSVLSAYGWKRYREPVIRDTEGLGPVTFTKLPSLLEVVGLPLMTSHCNLSKCHSTYHGDKALYILPYSKYPLLLPHEGPSPYLKNSKFISNTVPLHSTSSASSVLPILMAGSPLTLRSWRSFHLLGLSFLATVVNLAT